MQEPVHEITIKDQVTFLHEFLQTDIEKGVFITGSSITYLIASEYMKVLWTPNDIDICINSSNFQETHSRLHELLALKSTKWETLTTPHGYTSNNYYIDGFVRVSLQGTKINYTNRVTWTDYSVCAIASDRHQIVTHENTRYDIENKILRRTGPFRKTEADSKTWLERRYQSYTSKGFLDKDKIVWKQIQEFLKEPDLK